MRAGKMGVDLKKEIRESIRVWIGCIKKGRENFRENGDRLQPEWWDCFG